MSKKVITPGSVIGILGSGQLGRMLALEARRMGYRLHVFSPGRDTPTGQVADREICAPYDDLEAVAAFARQVDVVTYEFENVPAATAGTAGQFVPVRPGPQALEAAQNRLREKEFLAGQGLPTTPFAAVNSLDDLRAGLTRLGYPAVLKTAVSGYDGKGQRKIDDSAQIEAAWQAIGRQEAILEAFVPFEREISVVAARGLDGQFVHYGAIENRHRRHILDLSLSPAGVSGSVAAEAVRLAQAVLEGLDVVGALCVEFFLLPDGRLLINEIAPRPHNSGHFTIDACVTNQFEQQLRAVCGLPLGDTTQFRPAAMANLLGDLWQNQPPHWERVCAIPQLKLHLYGKVEARPGRKMGHLTALAATTAEAANLAIAARRQLEDR